LSQHQEKININFSEIENEVDPNNTYEDRLLLIQEYNSNKIKYNKNKIEELNKEKIKVTNLKIKELLSKEHFDINIEETKQKNLISLLLRNGFIDEDYNDYISIFYEGSITKQDHQFLLNIKSQIASPFNYHLNKIEKLLEKIYPTDFEKDYIFNFQLIEFIINNDKYKNQRASIFNLIKNESKTSLDFIDQYIEYNKSLNTFFKTLCNYWTNIWNYIDQNPSFTDEKKEQYAQFIITYADMIDIQNVSSISNFKNYLESNSQLIYSIYDAEKLKIVIKELDLKFKELEFEKLNPEITDFIYEFNHYDLNIKMIENVIKTKERFDQINFETKNYWYLRNSNCKSLYLYIYANINQYIENIYLIIDSNKNEDEESLIELLNHQILNTDNKYKIIKKVNTKIQDIDFIEQLEIENFLFKESKVLPTWENIYSSFISNEKEITETIILFLNNIENAKELSKVKLNNNSDIEEGTSYTEFRRSIIGAVEIKNNCYQLIIKSFPFRFNPKITDLTKEKINLLILNNNLSFNDNNYKSIKSNFPDLHIKLLEYNKSSYLNELQKYDLDSEDLSKLLDSKILNAEEKNILIENTDRNLIISNKSNILKIADLIIENNGLRIEKYFVEIILLNTEIDKDKRLKIFNIKHELVDQDLILKFLNSLPEDFYKIALNGKRPSIENSELNQKFVEILESKKIISNYVIEKEKIKIFTFRNDHTQSEE